MRLLNRITQLLFLPFKLIIRLLSGGRVFPSKAQRNRRRYDKSKQKYYARKRWETAMNPNKGYEKWYNNNIEELRIKWAECGADREMDFDEDRELEREYSKYNKSGRRKGDSTTPYLSLESLTTDVKSLHYQINNPLGGIKNIQDEHSRYIQKSSKNQISCLEDNMDMVLDKLNTLEKNKATFKYVQHYLFDEICDSRIGIKLKALEDKLTELIQKDSDLTFLPSEYISSDEQSEAEDFWDKKSREAYDEYMQSL